MDPSQEVTQLLQQLGSGKRDAVTPLVNLLYDEMKTMALKFLREERPGHTLQPTALVNEAYMKLVDQRSANFQSRGHFMAVAAMVMRRILVNHAKARAAAKRGGGAKRITLDENLVVEKGRFIDLVKLDTALEKLAQKDARKVAVVEQRFFARLELKEIGENLGISLATVKRDWEFARTWLMRELTDDG